MKGRIQVYLLGTVFKFLLKISKGTDREECVLVVLLNVNIRPGNNHTTHLMPT